MLLSFSFRSERRQREDVDFSSEAHKVQILHLRGPGHGTSGHGISFIMDGLERITDDNALDWETESDEHRARRRARLQVLVDTLRSTGPESVYHQLKAMVPVLITMEDTVLYLLGLNFAGETPESEVTKRDNLLTEVRTSRRDVAERGHELQVAHQFGWNTLKEYQKRTGSGCNKELLAAAEAVKARSERTGRRRDKGAEPYKKSNRSYRAPPQPQWAGQTFPPNCMTGAMVPAVAGMGSTFPANSWPASTMTSAHSGLGYAAGIHPVLPGRSDTGREYQGYPRNERRLDLCYRCGEPGHHAPHCPQQKKV